MHHDLDLSAGRGGALRATIVLLLSAVTFACQRQEAPPPQTPAADGAAGVQAAALAGNPDRDAYCGELHLHTSWSFDAYSRVQTGSQDG